MLSITKSEDGREITLEVGEPFEITLPENRTAGYKWNVSQTFEPILSLERLQEDNVPRTDQGRLIAGGAHPGRWRGHAVREGTAVLDFHYVGPAKQTIDTFKINARVKSSSAT